MGFGNYGICDLWDFGIMGEGGRRGAKQREKGRAIALVHQQFLLPMWFVSFQLQWLLVSQIFLLLLDLFPVF